MGGQNIPAKEQMIKAMKLPYDVFLGELVITAVGGRSVYVENYRSILLYTNTCLKIAGKSNKIIISGENLKIEYYAKDEMKVTGAVRSIEMEA